MADGRSALAELGIKKFPVGTLDGIRKQGLDEKNVACCAMPIKDQVRGCPVWDLCRFDHRSMGAFKGTGPRYVGFRILDPALGDLGTNQDIHACYAWVHGLQKRADFGAAARRESGGRRGEVIRIIAQEGEEIQTRYDLPINGKGEVVNVMPEMLETLKENEIKYSLLPGEVSVGRKNFVLKRKVPVFPRVGEGLVVTESFAQQVAMMDMDIDAEARERIDYAASPVRQDEPPANKSRNPWGRAGKPKADEAQT